MIEQKVQNQLFIDNTELGKKSQAEVKIRNLALVEVDYLWHLAAHNISIDNKMGRMKPN